MTFYEGYVFFLYLFIALLPAIVLGLLEKPLRIYTLLISILFIYFVFRDHPKQFLYLTLFYLFEFALLQIYLRLRQKYERKKSIYYGAVILSLLPLILSKCTPFWNLNIFCFLGISYLTFKAIQMIIEIYDGIIVNMPLFEWLGFFLFFPSLSSGPIDRSRRFHQDWIKKPSRKEYVGMLGDGLWKLLLGLVYKIVFAFYFHELMGCYSKSIVWYDVISYSYAYGCYLFFDFAGYSLMAIGTSYILGIKTPDNFRKPFLAVDIRDFWDRWHITLSHWFRDFIFTRFVMTCVHKKWFHTRLQRASAGFLVNMFIMGLWHGLHLSYLLYGLYHGGLLAVTELYQKKSAFYKKYKNNHCYRMISWFITMQLVMFGFLIFSGRFLEILTLIGGH